MNSGHDLGGMMGFGPVQIKHQNTNFHKTWEARIFSLTLAMGATGSWNIDASRHARESMHPGLYTTLSYYQIWLAGLEKLLLDADLVSASELAEGHQHYPAKDNINILKKDQVTDLLMAGSSYERETGTQPLFNPGDSVTTKNIHPTGHTRIPRYVRAKTGTVECVHGHHVFPDSNAHGLGEDPQWLYRISFSARDIWGTDRPQNDRIFVDLWEPYLEQ